MGEPMNNAARATKLGLAFIANNKTNEILSCVSAGGSWSGNVKLNQASSETPAVALFQGRFWTVSVSDDARDELLVSSSQDGVTWSTNSKIGQRSEVAPSLCVFDKRLWVAFIADDSSKNILVCSTADGVHWTGNVKVGQTSDHAPSLCVLGDRMYLAFVAKNSARELLICNTTDGKVWSSNRKINQSTKQAPSLCAFKGRLWLAFVANDDSESLLVCSSDGSAWTNNSRIGQASKFAPSLAALGDRLHVAFVSNDSAQETLLCSSSDGRTWSGNTKIGQTSKRAPALFPQELTTGTVRPKYQVLAVFYAPPGTAGGQSTSQVKYLKASSAGTTSSISSSVQTGVSVVATVGSDDLGGSANFSTTNTTGSTSTLDVVKRDTHTITVQGPPSDGIDHGSDIFYLCLNPLYSLTVDQTATARWSTGIAGEVMHNLYVYASWLKDPSTMNPGVKKDLDAAGLTPDDYKAILAHNPFANGATTIDRKRYMLTGQTFPYVAPQEPNATPVLTEYEHENTIDRSRSQTSEVQYAVSATVTAGMPDIWSVQTTTSLQLTNSNTRGISEGQTQSATVAVGGPAYGYDGPVDILVFWDTVYNTFMFAFPTSAPDVTGRTAAGEAVTLAVEGRTLRTYADARGDYRFYDVPAGTAKVATKGAPVTAKARKSGVTVVS